MSEEKTHITHSDCGFDFLGWNFRKYVGKLLIKPSKNSIGHITRKIGDVIKLIDIGILWQLGTRVFSTGRNRVKLFSDTKIVRCAGLKLDKNPFIDQDYFNFRNRCPILKGL